MADDHIPGMRSLLSPLRSRHSTAGWSLMGMRLPYVPGVGKPDHAFLQYIGREGECEADPVRYRTMRGDR